jgi:hypothetical protein
VEKVRLVKRVRTEGMGIADKIAVNLSKEFKPANPADAVRRAKTTFRDDAQNILLAKRLREQTAAKVKRAFGSSQVSIAYIMKMAAMEKEDSSLKALEVFLSRKAVDNTAKSYYERYLGGYGKALTRDVEELMKQRKLSAKELLFLRDVYQRNYGMNSKAVVVLATVINKLKEGFVERQGE